jgi:hypothetical protein
LLACYLETQQQTAAVILQLTNSPSLTLHIIMAFFVQPSLKTVFAYLKLSVKNIVETELSNHKRRKQIIKENRDYLNGVLRRTTKNET